jgi:hypothetical protein
MTGQQLGRLERVELRDIWISEATSFTPWLARPWNGKNCRTVWILGSRSYVSVGSLNEPAPAGGRCGAVWRIASTAVII